MRRLLLVMLIVSSLWVWGVGQTPEAVETYRLNPGDHLNITVLGEPLLSGDQLIGPDGTIRLPLIGTVMAAGLTLDELTQRLTQSLRRFLRDPKVVVALKQLPPMFRRIYVLGAVKMPGAYALPTGGSATVIDAIALAGGFAEEADLERVRIFQKDGRVLTVNLKNFQADGFRLNGSTLQPGDLVWVPPAFVRVSIGGAVNLPGYHSVPPSNDPVRCRGAGGRCQRAQCCHQGLPQWHGNLERALVEVERRDGSAYHLARWRHSFGGGEGSRQCRRCGRRGAAPRCR